MKIIIDTSFVCYRSLYGMPQLSNDEKNTHVIFNFLNIVLKLALEFKASDFVFAFDSKNSYRKLVYPQYKENRKTKTDRTEQEQIDFKDMLRQRGDLKNKVLPYLGFKNIFEQSGYESDDIIAEIVKKYREDQFLVVQRDEDLYQLLEKERVILYDLKEKYTEEMFRKKYFNIHPNEWRYVKSISGCSGDNIVGIERVGDITAAKYLAGLLRAGKILSKIEEQRSDFIEINFPLVSLPYSKGIRPLKIELQQDEIDLDNFKSLFGQYGFRYFLSEKVWDKWIQAFIF